MDLFRLNAEQFPQDWNVHDWLGEAYLKQGDNTLSFYAALTD